MNENIRCLAHTLRGTLATYLYPEIAEAGAVLERKLRIKPPAGASEIAVPLRTLIDACRDAQREGSFTKH